MDENLHDKYSHLNINKQLEQLDLALPSLRYLLQKLFLLQCLQGWFSLHAVGTNYSCGSMM